MDLLNKEHSKKEHSPLIFRHMTVSGTVIAKKKNFLWMFTREESLSPC